MATTNMDGPTIVYGDMSYLPLVPFGTYEPDPNPDAGPSISYQGDALPDVRYAFDKDRTTGFLGRVPALLNLSYIQSVDQVPWAVAAANIAAAANVTNGTAMTLVSASGAGVTVGVPIIPWSAALNSGTPVNALVLDFGFAFGTTTAGSTTITVADSTQFVVGMPLVIADAGAAAAGTPLLTWVTGITDATHITVNDAALRTATPVAIGAGNLWTPGGDMMAGIASGGGALLGYPTGHLPYLAKGPGLFLDPSQSIARAVAITGVTGGSGGVFQVRGWDVFWQPMREDITAGAGAGTTKGRKAFKGIASVTPQFTDAHNYSVGTTDTFGMHVRSDKWEYSAFFYNAGFGTTASGWTAADKTSPATATTGDVRGTIDITNAGGFNSASNGTVTALAMAGRRLAIFSSLPLYNTIRATPFSTPPMFGVTQFFA